MKPDLSVVILGNGIAGYTAAQVIKKAGAGIRLRLVSAETEPTYSACVFAEYIAGEIDKARVFLQGQDRVQLAASEWVLGQRAAEIDLARGRVLMDGGGGLSFDRLVLATGSRAVVPALPGVDKEGVYCLKTLADADAILAAEGADAVVVGSGPVGLEVAVALRKRGWNVTVLELLDRILPRLFAPVQSSRIQAVLEKLGIRVLVGERLQGMEGGRRVEAVVTDRRTLACQLVLLGIGMRPEVDLADRAGIRIGSTGGIEVDTYMRTSHEAVFACGDCVESRDRLTGRRGLYMLWGNAKMQGVVAGLNCLGQGKRYPGSLNLTTLKLQDTVAASIGEVEGRDGSYGEIVRDLGRQGSIRLVLKEGIVRGIQTVGPRVDMSVFLSMMLCGERLNVLKESRDKRSLLGRKPWLVRLPPYLRE